VGHPVGEGLAESEGPENRRDNNENNPQ